jgi:hypothetical protein
MLVSFLLGYILGKHQGWVAGCSEMEADMPLQIRQKSLELGKCIICDDEYLPKVLNNEKNNKDLETL